jgi:hypothetical protein
MRPVLILRGVLLATGLAVAAMTPAQQPAGCSSESGCRYQPIPVSVPLTSQNSNLPDRAPRATQADRARGANLRLEADRDDVPADGQSPVTFTVRVFDVDGKPLAGSSYVTVEVSGGRIQLPGRDTDETRVGRGDLDRVIPGVQVRIEGGVGRFLLLAPQEPQDVTVRVTSGALELSGVITFLPELRPLLATGFIEGAVARRSAVPGTGQESELERELSHTSSTFADGKGIFGAATELFVKGEVQPGYLLTLAYDSEKAALSPFFRDIRPEEFYPIYGDAAQRGFEAQSTKDLYVRVDRNKSYLLYGDFQTGSAYEAQALGQYARSLTGLRHHLENRRVELDTFVTHDRAQQVIEEQPARGISGPYFVGRGDGLRNSERVEILTRDRNQPAVILTVQAMTRFVDYSFEPFSGQIIFKSPIPTVDARFNPLTIRVTYEIDQGGPEFWLAGVDGAISLTDRLAIGGSLVEDQDPSARYRLFSANSTYRFGANTMLFAEAALSENELAQRGSGGRVEFRHAGERLQVRGLWGLTGVDFRNPSATLQSGRSESSLNASYTVNAATRLYGEALRSEDRLIGARRAGMQIGVERRLTDWLALDLGMRRSHDEGGAVNAGAAGITNIASGQGFTPYQVNAPTVAPIAQFADFSAWHAGLKAQPNKRSSLFAEFERDIDAADKRRYALGADYQVAERARLYARHEWLASTSGDYGLVGDDRTTSSTIIGIDSSYRTEGQLFSEYRLRDAISGRDAHAALGLRNIWNLREGVRVSGGFERQQAFGVQPEVATALTGGLELSYDPLWRGTARLELRRDPNYDAALSTLGYDVKIARDWSLLARNYYNRADARSATAADRFQDRLQVGMAFAQTDTNVWAALGRYERKWESDATVGAAFDRAVDIVSTHASYHPRRPLWLSGRLAGKWVDETLDGVNDRYTAYLVGGRVIYDLTKRIDLGFSANVLYSPTGHARQYAAGPEAGYLLAENLWLSLGFNWSGFEDRDLSGEDYTNRGVFLRLRFKFDEDLFGRGRAGVDPSVAAAPKH